MVWIPRADDDTCANLTNNSRHESPGMFVFFGIAMVSVTCELKIFDHRGNQ